MAPRPPQTESTYALARRAIAAGDAAEGVRRIRQLLDEAAEGRELFPLFIDRARRFLAERGVTPAAVSAEERRILALLGADSGGALDMDRQWAAVRQLAARAEQACLTADREAASGLVEQLRSSWLAVHDRFCDITAGLFTLAARELGEPVIGAMWDDAIGDLYPSRDAYDTARLALVGIGPAAACRRGRLASRSPVRAGAHRRGIAGRRGGPVGLPVRPVRVRRPHAASRRQPRRRRPGRGAFRLRGYHRAA